MIEVNGVTKHYGDKVAVDDLSFEVNPGQVTGFLGPNGSGKSTTMRMIMGLDALTQGQSESTVVPIATFPCHFARSGPSWKPRPSTPAEARTTTCCISRNQTTFLGLASMKSSSGSD